MKRSWLPSGIFLLIIITIIIQATFAQPLHLQFQHLSDQHGLSNNRVWAITQDKYGFMWIATGDGLNRYDGYNLNIYRNDPGNRSTIPGNLVRCLFTDSRGLVWIGTSNGLAYYDYTSNSFHSFLYNKAEDSVAGNSISAINEDQYGTIWIGTNTGLCSFDRKSRRFQRFLHSNQANSISSNYIRDIEFAPDGSMWVSTGKGLNRLDLTTKNFRSFFHDPEDSTTLSGNTLTKMEIDKQGNLWLSVNETIFMECFNTKTFRVTHYRNFTEQESHVPSNHPRDFFIDDKGRLWVGTDQAGLYVFMPDRNIFYQYKADLLDPNKLQSNTVVGMYQDKSNMIWLASFGGVERCKPDQSKFMLFRPKPTSTESSANNAVQDITEDSAKRLWIGTFHGIFVLDRKTNSYLNFQRADDRQYTLSNNVIQSLYKDSKDKIWVGTFSGLNLFDPGLKGFRKYSTQKDTARGISFIMSLVPDKNGDLLIGGAGGLSVYNYQKDAVTSLLKESVYCIFVDENGIVWMGGGGLSEGLTRYDRATGKKEMFLHIPGNANSLPSNLVQSITQDHQGLLWIGTGAGLCSYDKSTKTFTRFTEKNGLPNVHVAQLLVDNKDRIWMSTNRGISMLNENRTAFSNYDPSDGLQGLEFNSKSAFKTHDGYFCYAGKNGFNMFHPDSLEKNEFVPPVMLNGITIFDQPLEIDSSFADLKKLTLSYKQNFFSFEFVALNYDHPEKNRYAYQLLNFDKKEIQNGTNRVFSYTNVPPGEYTLRVRASNNDGVWNDTGFELSLIIIPPFWATWWFKLLVVIAALAAVFIFFKIRENRIKKEQLRQTEINKRIAEIRMAALRGQMNPHFIFNSLNSIQHFITTREKEEALNYLSKFSKLIRKILENSRENTVSLNNELQLLELYIQLEQLRFSEKFDYHIKIDPQIDIENTEIPPLLIQPYIENAILHGLISKNEKGDLWLTMERNNGLLVCTIEDNGIGRAKAKEIEARKESRHKSLGIKLTEERISGLYALLDYKMEVITEDLYRASHHEPAGTRVTISIPVKEEV